MASGWNLWVWLQWVWLVGVVIRRYIDRLALFLAAASLLLCSFLKCFFGLVYVIFLQYINKRYSKNIRDRSKKIEITRM